MEVSKKDYKILKSALAILSFLLTSAILILKAIINACLPKSYKKLKKFEGEIVLITGGAGGIGRLVALRLARLKATIVIWDINSKGIEESVKLIEAGGGKAYGYKCDLTNREDIYKVAAKVDEEVGQITILINNAGVVSSQPLLDIPDHLIQRTFDVNILAHFWTVKAFLPKMIENNHGHVVTIASLAGQIGVHKLVDYSSSKFAAVGFDESIRLELEKLGATGVKTTLVCPYFVQQTGMFSDIVSVFLPTLPPNEVADQIVDGIELEKISIIIPWYLWTVCLKWILPWSVISLFLRTVVRGTNVPEKPSPNKVQEDTKNNIFRKSPESELNHRVHVTEKF